MSGICAVWRKDTAERMAGTLASVSRGLSLSAAERVEQRTSQTAGVAVSAAFQTQQIYGNDRILVACDADLYNEAELRESTGSREGTETAALFLKSHGKNGIRLVGYDLLDKNIEYLNLGIIDFLIHQKPEQQAFEGISCLANHLIFKKEIRAINLFPLEVITRQNLGSYLIDHTEYHPSEFKNVIN